MLPCLDRVSQFGEDDFTYEKLLIFNKQTLICILVYLYKQENRAWMTTLIYFGNMANNTVLSLPTTNKTLTTTPTPTTMAASRTVSTFISSGILRARMCYHSFSVNAHKHLKTHTENNSCLSTQRPLFPSPPKQNKTKHKNCVCNYVSR